MAPGGCSVDGIGTEEEQWYKTARGCYLPLPMYILFLHVLIIIFMRTTLVAEEALWQE